MYKSILLCTFVFSTPSVSVSGCLIHNNEVSPPKAAFCFSDITSGRLEIQTEGEWKPQPTSEKGINPSILSVAFKFVNPCNVYRVHNMVETRRLEGGKEVKQSLSAECANKERPFMLRR